MVATKIENEVIPFADALSDAEAMRFVRELEDIDALIVRRLARGATDYGLLADMLSLARQRLPMERTAHQDHEYKADVRYEALPGRDELAKQFDYVGCSGAFPIDHSLCENIDRTPGERTFVLRCFADPWSMEDEVRKAAEGNLRPPILVETLTFARHHPTVQLSCRIAAPGAFVSGTVNIEAMLFPVLLAGKPNKRGRQRRWFSQAHYASRFGAGTRLLLIRK